jgi:hypothetical protein
MSADTIIPAHVLEAKREERERLRREREAWAGSILGVGLLDDDDDQPCAPASPAQKETTTR